MDGQELLGPSGSSTVLGVNIKPASATPSGDGLAVDLLSDDGKAASVALPTSEPAAQETLASAGSLVGVIAGEPAGNAVVDLTNAVAAPVATVTSTADGIAQPVIGAVNGVLAPVVGEGSLLAPVTGLADGLTGNLPIVGSTDPARSMDGPLVAGAAGGSALTGPSTTDTAIGVNLGGGTSAVEGQLVTADVLTPPYEARRLAAAIPGARLHLVPGAGHMVMLERTEDFDRLLVDFAREVGARRPA